MSELSEEEIMKILKDTIRLFNNDTHCFTHSDDERVGAIQGLLDLYQKEKEKNDEYYKRIVELSNETGDLKQEIESLNNKIDMQKDIMQDMKEQHQEEFENRDRWD